MGVIEDWADALQMMISIARTRPYCSWTLMDDVGIGAVSRDGT